MAKSDLSEFVSENDGVVSVSELAGFLELDEQVVRRWARDNEVRRIGPNFAFSADRAEALADELLGEDEESDDEAGEEEDGEDDDADSDGDESDDESDSDDDESDDENDEK